MSRTPPQRHQASNFHLPHWAVILLLFFIPPIAWWHMWKNHRYHRWFPYVLWFNSALTIGFSLYVIVHFFPILTEFFDVATYIFLGHIGLLILSLAEILFALFIYRKFKSNEILTSRILLLVILLLFINAIAIPISHLTITAAMSTIAKQNDIPNAPTNSSAIGEGWQTYKNTYLGFALTFPLTYSVFEESKNKVQIATDQIGSNGFWITNEKDSTFVVLNTLKTCKKVEEEIAQNPSMERPICLDEGKKFGQNEDIATMQLGGKEAKSFYETSTGQGGTVHVIQTVNQPKIQIYAVYFPTHLETVNQILSTFRFLEPDRVDAKTGWKIYTDKKNGFEFEYPPIYTNNYSTNSFSATADPSNMLSVDVHTIPFEDYSYMDAGGGTHSFDVKNKKWRQGELPPSFVKTNTTVEGYKIGFGDGGCLGDILVIPHPSYSYVIEVSNLYCSDITENRPKPPVRKLTSEELIDTFKFTN